MTSDCLSGEIRGRAPDPGRCRDVRSLASRARLGDERASALLIASYEPGLRKTAGEVLGPMLRAEADVEDLIQSVHGEIWSGLRDGRYEVDSAAGLLALGRAILRAKAARLWRRRGLREESEGRWSGGPGRPAEGSDSAEDPTGRVAADDQFERLCREMTPTERRLIELRMLGHTTAEAARVMGRDSQNLRVTLNRLRKRIRLSGILAEPPEAGPAR